MFCGYVIELRKLTALLLASAAMLVCGQHAALADNPYSAFVDWTNDKAEEIWGFESHCPKFQPRDAQPIVPNACMSDGRTLTSSVFNPEALGITAEELEEWTWITEAISIRKQATEKNKEHLERMLEAVKALQAGAPVEPELQADIERIEQNMLLLAKFPAEEKKLADSTLPSCRIFFDDECHKRHERFNAGKRQQQALLTLAQSELLNQTPILAHRDMRAFIKQLSSGYYDYQPGERNFLTNLKSSLEAANALTAKRLAQYAKIQKEEKELAQVIHASEQGAARDSATDTYRQSLADVRKQTELLEELAISIDPSKLGGFEGLSAAGCRIQNRVFKGKAMRELRGLVFDSALTLATLGLGPLVRGAKAVSGIRAALRLSPLVALESAWVGLDVTEIRNQARKCDAIAVNAVAGDASPRALEECQENLSDQKVLFVIKRIPALLSFSSVLARRVNKVDDVAQAGTRLPPSNLATRAAAEWQARTLVSDMLTCIKTMPAKKKAQAITKQALMQLGVNEAFTVAGYVSGSGAKKVDWANLPVDMAVGGAATFIEPFFATGSGTLLVRYLKMTALGGTKSGVEAGLYLANPLSGADAANKGETALARAEYSTVWAAGNSVAKIGLNTFLLGMQCLYPQSRIVHLGNAGVQFVFRAGSSFGYFYLRNKIIDPGKQTQ